MEKNKEKQTFIVQVMLVIFFALLISYPVTIYIKKANNPSDFLTEQQLKAIESQNLTFTPVATAPAPLTTEGGLSVGRQTTRYSTTGQAIVTVNIYNITKLSADDFKKVGSTPWSLMNTVRSNIARPQIVDIVFNNDVVVDAFMTRATTAELTGNYLKVYDMLVQGSPVIDRFLNNPTVDAVVNDSALLGIVAKSKLISRILASPAGQYFINNPQITKKLVYANPSFKNVLANPKLKQVLFAHPQTAQAAKILYQ